MQLVHDIDSLHRTLAAARRDGHRIGLVPTMGNLHAGHLALVAAARERADFVVASIFVNPLQFGPGEDFSSYPRTLQDDRKKLDGAGCDLVFAPSAATIYPNGMQGQSTVSVPVVSEGLCGSHRIGHFDGVATVVSLLFHLVQPDVACFGEKDFQQLAVIRKMVADLHFPIDIVGVPTVRADDGLALSSRNGYLDIAERERAATLYRALRQGRDALTRGEAVETTLTTTAAMLEDAGFRLDYLELRSVDLASFDPEQHTEARLLAAVILGSTRLIDNIAVSLPRSTDG